MRAAAESGSGGGDLVWPALSPSAQYMVAGAIASRARASQEERRLPERALANETPERVLALYTDVARGRPLREIPGYSDAEKQKLMALADSTIAVKGRPARVVFAAPAQEPRPEEEEAWDEYEEDADDDDEASAFGGHDGEEVADGPKDRTDELRVASPLPLPPVPAPAPAYPTPTPAPPPPPPSPTVRTEGGEVSPGRVGVGPRTAMTARSPQPAPEPSSPPPSDPGGVSLLDDALRRLPTRDLIEMAGARRRSLAHSAEIAASLEEAIDAAGAERGGRDYEGAARLGPSGYGEQAPSSGVLSRARQRSVATRASPPRATASLPTYRDNTVRIPYDAAAPLLPAWPREYLTERHAEPPRRSLALAFLALGACVSVVPWLARAFGARLGLPAALGSGPVFLFVAMLGGFLVAGSALWLLAAFVSSGGGTAVERRAE